MSITGNGNGGALNLNETTTTSPDSESLHHPNVQAKREDKVDDNEVGRKEGDKEDEDEKGVNPELEDPDFDPDNVVIRGDYNEEEEHDEDIEPERGNGDEGDLTASATIFVKAQPLEHTSQVHS